MKRFHSVLLALGFGFLLYLVCRVGPGELWREFKSVWWMAPLLIVAEGCGNVAHAAGWQQCLGEGRVRLLRLFPISMAGYAINYLTPSASIGGDVIRASLLTHHYSRARATGSVVLDKLMTALAHLLLVVLGAGLAIWRAKLPLGLWLAFGLPTGILAVAMLAFLFLQKRGKLGGLCRWLVRHRIGGSVTRKLADELSAVDLALADFYSEHTSALIKSISWHALGHSMALVQAWCFLKLVHQPAPWSTAAALGVMSLWFDLLTFMVPMNLGTLEGSRVLIYKALGGQALTGMAFGLAVRLAQLFWACFGLVCYGVIAARVRRPGLRGAPTAGSPSGRACARSADHPHRAGILSRVREYGDATQKHHSSI